MDFRSDAELAVAAADGNRDALGAIYDRYADTLYELCRAVLRDSHEASDALQDTFVIAATRLKGLREPDRLKPWLCAIARHESMRRSSKRARSRPAQEEVLDVPVSDDSANNLIAADAAALVWEAAEALTDRERSLLTLNVRQGLEGAELAEAAGLPGAQASVILSRAKTQLASAVRCTLLIRNGRKDCSELNEIVPRAHAALDGLTRKRVARHAATCEICEPKWNSSPDGLGILAAAPLLGVPAGLKSKVLDDPRLISNSRPLGGSGWTRDGWPPAEERPRRRVFASVAAASIAMLIAAGLLLAGDNKMPVLSTGDEDPITTLAGPSTTQSAPTTEPGDTTTTSNRRTTTTKKPTTATTTKPGGTPGTNPTTPTTVPAPTTTTAPPVTVTSSGPRSATACSGFRITAKVTGTFSGGVFITLKDASGSTSGKNMTSSGGGNYFADFGPVENTGTATWTVITTTGARSTGSLTITPCSTNGSQPIPQ